MVTERGPDGANVNSQGREPLVALKLETVEAPRGRKCVLMPQSFGSLHCHIVFSTKHRRAQLAVELHLRLFEYAGGILRNRECRLVAAGGMPDHVHLLVSMSRKAAVADVVRIVKSNSSAWLSDEVGILIFIGKKATGLSRLVIRTSTKLRRTLRIKQIIIE
jgi:REP element-mobilizing transposase RayT